MFIILESKNTQNIRQINKTIFVGKFLLDFEELPSTNQFAMDCLAQSTPLSKDAKSKPTDGTAISTFRQTAGRGQIGSHWFSEPDKNISFSLIFYPTFLRPHEQFYLNKAIALAIRQFVENTLNATLATPPKVTIKWSNDIFVGNKKITGILIQNNLTNQYIVNSVIGIGMNINQLQFSESAGNPTSLAIETGKNFDLYEILEDICLAIEQNYLLLRVCARKGDFSPFDAQYLKNLYRIHIPSPFRRLDETVFVGTIRGVTEGGKLMIEHSDKIIENFDIKEIKFL
jgi:BirA family biotin operon repressor/biotin-[acetyl-CoA-carboxylase] ligase